MWMLIRWEGDVSDLFFGSLAGILLGLSAGLSIARCVDRSIDWRSFAKNVICELGGFLLFNGLLIFCLVIRAID
jgi:hypothetical membrane protein